MSKLIVNADDFGYCEGVNYGIISAHRNGIVTSTTIMANMSGFDHAVNLLKENKNLGCGVHMTLSCNKPLNENLKSLVDENGMFYRRINEEIINKIDLDELVTEESMKYIENNEHYSQAIALLYEISINKISCNTKRIVANSYVFGKNTELMKGIILVATKKDCLELFSYMVENSVGEKAYWVSEEKIKEYMIDFYKDVDCMSEVRFPKELALKKENIYQIKKNIVMINYYENYMTI